MSAAEERRLTPTEREHELAMAIAARRPSPTAETMTTKDNAKGEALIDSLTTARHESESWRAWITRHAEMHSLAVSLLRPETNGGNGGHAEPD